MMLIKISDDALARALGADDLAAAFEAKGHEVHRTSSWGMQWLEPLVEIDGRGFGPATLDDVDAILDGSSPKAIGVIEQHPFIAGQTRLTFARAGKTRPLSLDDYAATGGWTGLMRAREIGPERQLVPDRRDVRRQPISRRVPAARARRPHRRTQGDGDGDQTRDPGTHTHGVAAAPVGFAPVPAAAGKM